ncbi:hypothetical protein CONLIGDRAFT_678995 [Coniochaeta ligniaria NRRL 30616]|uniref:Uncharacterized protein n=1 Tax=Coniochaeta ligniaria NRRL 30616 TaxID=1408157 RepID=A0A1J7IZM3_9PEZI|nr:hypothetical protein CONLIGDRAFT_678995 [Coniochaeta ligniaria NRRL 30616]
MSRNARQKLPPARAPKPKKRRVSDTTTTSSSSLDLSDDEGYSAVDEISESEDDDEEHVFAAEEEHIISHEAHRGHPRSLPPQQAVEDDADEEDEDDDDDEDTELPEQASEEVEHADEDDDDGDEVASWDGILSDGEDAAASDFTTNYMLDTDVSNVERHVRFTGVPDSDSDSTTTDTSEDVEGFFPDIFVEQASLDPAFRREIEYDPDESSNSGGSFWDFGSQDRLEVDSDDEVTPNQGLDDSTPTPTPTVSQAPTEASTPVASGVVQELDGYETDGDTTEEDVPEPPVRRKLVRRIESIDVSSDSDTERPRRKRGQPRVGRYNLDSSDRKPVAVLNPISRKMMIFTPQRMRRLDLSPESFNLDFFTNPPITQSSPILSNSASLMMSAMFSSNTFGDFVNTQAVGPAEAFFSLASDAATAEDSDETGEADEPEDEEERNLKLEDFITFNQDSDEEGQDENWDGDGDTNTAASTPGRPRTSASQVSAISDGAMADVHPLLSHFDNNSNAVGAFRRNQINQQLILSDRASHESLAFSGPYHYGTLRGIKTGSLETVTAPITPLRRNKKSAANGYADINRSPLESMSQKRKASSALSDAFHKRHRSISDMEVLHL